jgi:hypothetical protein
MSSKRKSFNEAYSAAYADIQSMISVLRAGKKNLILCLSTKLMAKFKNTTNAFNVSILDVLKKDFPDIRFVEVAKRA